MSFKSVLFETTPKHESSSPLNQSNDGKQDLALTLNQSLSDVNTSVMSITSDTSTDINTSKSSRDVSKEHNPRNIGTKDGKPEHREDVKRRRNRRARKRKWKNMDHRYKRMKVSDERHGSQSGQALGQPLAPYNTTQFIMNEHNCDKEIDFKFHRMKRSEDNDHSGDPNDPNDDDFYSSPEDESDYLQQQFHEAYDNIHAERLSSMNKNELVQEYLQLEDRVEDLERRLKESTSSQTIRSLIRTTNNSEVQTELSSDGHNSVSEVTEAEHTIRGIEGEIKRLSEENQRLKSDNQRLERILSEHHITGDSQI